MGHGLMTVDYTVWCGVEDCPCWEYVSGNNKRNAAITAKRGGWRQSKHYGWLCPVHAVDETATAHEATVWDNYRRNESPAAFLKEIRESETPLSLRIERRFV